MAQKIKVFTFTNNSGRALTLNGVTREGIDIPAEGTADVHVTQLLEGWPERLRAFGRFIGVSTKYIALSQPEFKFSPLIENLKFVTGNEVNFKVEFISNDYIGTIATFKPQFNGEYKLQAYKCGKWVDATSGVLVDLKNKKQDLKLKCIIGNGSEESAVTGNLTFTLNGEGYEPVETSTEITAVTPESLFFNSSASTTLDSTKFEVGEASEFDFSVVAGNAAGTKVKGLVKIDKPELVTSLQYQEKSEWKDLAGNTFGSADGFAFADATTKFKLTLASEKTATITISIVDASTNKVLVSTGSVVTASAT